MLIALENVCINQCKYDSNTFGSIITTCLKNYFEQKSNRKHLPVSLGKRYIVILWEKIMPFWFIKHFTKAEKMGNTFELRITAFSH